jgi:hypothetical protein
MYRKRNTFYFSFNCFINQNFINWLINSWIKWKRDFTMNLITLFAIKNIFKSNKNLFKQMPTKVFLIL